MSELDIQMEELITRLNRAESTIALIKSEWEIAEGDIATLFNIQPIGGDGCYQVNGQAINDLMRAISGDYIRIV